MWYVYFLQLTNGDVYVGSTKIIGDEYGLVEKLSKDNVT